MEKQCAACDATYTDEWGVREAPFCYSCHGKYEQSKKNKRDAFIYIACSASIFLFEIIIATSMEASLFASLMAIKGIYHWAQVNSKYDVVVKQNSSSK